MCVCLCVSVKGVSHTVCSKKKLACGKRDLTTSSTGCCCGLSFSVLGKVTVPPFNDKEYSVASRLMRIERDLTLPLFFIEYISFVCIIGRIVSFFKFKLWFQLSQSKTEKV